MRSRRRWFTMFLAGVLLLMLNGCVEKEKINDPTPQASPTGTLKAQDLRSYFPLIRGMVYNYTGQGKEAAGFVREVQYVSGAKGQFTDASGETVTAYVYDVGSDQITQLYHQTQKTEDKDLLGVAAKKKVAESIVLKTPLKAGTSWQSGEWKREIVGANSTVTVPAGIFYNVIKVKMSPLKGRNLPETYEYYAPNVGLVLREVKGGATDSLISYGMQNVAQGGRTNIAGVRLSNPDFVLLAYQLENQLRTAFRTAYESYINLSKLTTYNATNFEQIITVYRAAIEPIAAKSLVNDQLKRLRDYYAAGEGEVNFPDHEVVENTRINSRSAQEAQVILTIHKWFPAREWSGAAYDKITDYSINLIRENGLWKVAKVDVAE